MICVIIVHKSKMFHCFVVDKVLSLIDKDDMRSQERALTALNNLFTGQRNFAYWKVFNLLYRKITSMNGILYGGCVRDFVRRKIATNKFYDSFGADVARSTIDSSFNDPKVHPETYSARTCLPNDIDVFIDEEYAETLKKELAIIGFTVDSFVVKEDSYFSRSIAEDQRRFLEHHKMRIRFNSQTAQFVMLSAIIGWSLRDERRFNRNFTVNIDLIVKKPGCPDQLRPPFNNPDFRCNMLFMSKSISKSEYGPEYPFTISTDVDTVYKTLSSDLGELTSEQIHSLCIDTIKNDIVETKALLMKGDMDPYRFYKMFMKKYTIDYSYYFNNNPIEFGDGKRYPLKVVKPVPEGVPEGLPEKEPKCSGCCKPFEFGEKAVRVDCPCYLQFHTGCFLEYFDDGVFQCPKCRETSQECVCELHKIALIMKVKFPGNLRKSLIDVKERIKNKVVCTSCKTPKVHCGCCKVATSKVDCGCCGVAC